MSRVPTAFLTHSVGLALPGASSARGGSEFSAAVPTPAQVEDTAEIRIDQRTQSDTAGTEIQMRALVIVQLDRRIEPGARVTLPDGRVLTIAHRRHLEHRHAPSHSELWAV